MAIWELTPWIAFLIFRISVIKNDLRMTPKLEYHNDLYKRNAKVRRVVDGDTIDVDVDLGFHVYTRQRLRLLRVDTPEVRGKEREEGLKYKAFVEYRLPVGSNVIVQSYKTGKYGRYLAEVWYQVSPDTPRPLTYINLNEELLEKLTG